MSLDQSFLDFLDFSVYLTTPLGLDTRKSFGGGGDLDLPDSFFLYYGGLGSSPPMDVLNLVHLQRPPDLFTSDSSPSPTFFTGPKKGGG